MNKLLKEFLSYILVEERVTREPNTSWKTSKGWSAKRSDGETRSGFGSEEAANAWLTGTGPAPGEESDAVAGKSSAPETDGAKKPDTTPTGRPSPVSGILSRLRSATSTIVGSIKSFREKIYSSDAVGTGTVDSTKGEQSSCSSAEDFTVGGRIVDGAFVPGNVSDDDITTALTTLKHPKVTNPANPTTEEKRRAVQAAWMVKEKQRYLDNGTEPPSDRWLRTAYRSGYSTRAVLHERADMASTQAALRDGTLPPPMVTNEGAGGGKEAATKYLTNLRDTAPEGSEERAHYDRLLRAFGKAEDTDTCVFYVNTNGRISVLLISNKQGINNPHGNTGPRARIERIASSAQSSGLSESGQQALGAAVGRARDAIGTSTEEGTRAVQSHLERLSPDRRQEFDDRMQTLLTGPLPADRGRTKDYSPAILKARPVKKAMAVLYCTDNPDKCKKGKPVGSIPPDYQKENIGRAFSAAVESDPTNSTLRKILGKIEKVATDEGDKELLGPVLEVGSKMRAAAADAHSTIVSEVHDIDKQECGGSWDDKATACMGEDGTPQNGPATQTYVDAFMRDTHWDQYMCTDATNDDCSDQDAVGETKLVDIDGHKVTPQKFRECLATLSGYRGNTTSKEGQRGLWRHLKGALRIDPDEDSISVHGQDGPRIGKETYRTKGAQSALLTYLGPDMGKCVTGKD
jgi:hypothetical protein